ncbi:hypothetical protein [Micavibrio aeruginosavorus]|uniref:hypothetical protein n=1 Tax=Micavibrio aeruginosavorus TaxID=349221 RepID=UPI003F4AD9FE
MCDRLKLLKLVESANSSDTAILDEIDGRFWLYIHHPQLEYLTFDNSRTVFAKDESGKFHSFFEAHLAIYTRSRDELKRARPDGWIVTDVSYFSSTGEHTCLMRKKGVAFAYCEHAPTEELAELHAIVQAIALERKQMAGTTDNE